MKKVISAVSKRFRSVEDRLKQDALSLREASVLKRQDEKVSLRLMGRLPMPDRFRVFWTFGLQEPDKDIAKVPFVVVPEYGYSADQLGLFWKEGPYLGCVPDQP